MKLKKMGVLLASIMMVSSVGVTAFAASPEDAVDTDCVMSEPIITVSEQMGDGQIVKHHYMLEDLSCTIVDYNGEVIYDGPVNPDPDWRFNLKPATISRGSTVKWYPTDDPNGFKCGKNIAVTVSIETDTKGSKEFGLTNGGGTSSGTEKILSDILYTGTDGYWMLYVTNNTSSSIKVTGGSLSWGM